MQSIFQKGKNYLQVDASYLSNFVDGIEYDLRLTNKKCNAEKVIATANNCGTVVLLSFELKRCLEQEGKWKIDIYEKDTNNLLHSIFVQVYYIKSI